MNRTVFSMLAAAVLAAAPVGAQEVFLSDPTGPRVTGSEIAGYVIPVRDLEGALFRQVDGRTAFRTRGVSDAVLGEADAAQRAACAATLQPPREWPDSLRTLDPQAQRAVCGLLARPGLDSDNARRVLAALRGGQRGMDGDAAHQLVAALAGLAAERPGFVDERQRYTDGARWEAAIRAYQLYLDTVPDALMDPPSAEMVAIAVILDRVVDAGLAASGR